MITRRSFFKRIGMLSAIPFVAKLTEFIPKERKKALFETSHPYGDITPAQWDRLEKMEIENVLNNSFTYKGK
jgi:hypothetical protein